MLDKTIAMGDMLKFLLSIALLASSLPFYLNWGRSQAEEQLNKMQEAAFNTPGAEAPITLSIFAGGFALMGGHFLWCRLLGLRRWRPLASLVVGLGAGIGLFLWRFEEPPR